MRDDRARYRHITQESWKLILNGFYIGSARTCGYFKYQVLLAPCTTPCTRGSTLKMAHKVASMNSGSRSKQVSCLGFTGSCRKWGSFLKMIES